MRKLLSSLFLLYFSMYWRLSTAKDFKVACVVTEPLLQSEDGEDFVSELCTDVLFKKPSGLVEANAYDSVDPILNIRERNPDIRLYISLKEEDFYFGSPHINFDVEKIISNIISYLKLANAQGLNIQINRHTSNIYLAAARSLLHYHGMNLTVLIDQREHTAENGFPAYSADSIFVIPSRFKPLGQDDWEQKMITDASNITERLLLFSSLPVETVSVGLPSTTFLYSEVEPTYSRNYYNDYDSTSRSTANIPTRSELCKNTELKNWRPSVAIKEQLLWNHATGSQKWKLAMQFGSSIEDQLWTLHRLGGAGIVLYDLPHTKEQNPICKSQKMLFAKSVRHAIDKLQRPGLWRESRSDIEPSKSEADDSLLTSADVENSQDNRSVLQESGERVSSQAEEMARSFSGKMSLRRLARSQRFEEDDSKIDRLLNRQLRSQRSARGINFFTLSKSDEYEQFKDFFQMNDADLLDGPILSITLQLRNGIVSFDNKTPRIVTENWNLRKILNSYLTKVAIDRSSGDIASLLIFPSVQQTYPVPILVHWNQLTPVEVSNELDEADEPNELDSVTIILARAKMNKDYGQVNQTVEATTPSLDEIEPRSKVYFNPYLVYPYGPYRPILPHYPSYNLEKHTTRGPISTVTTGAVASDPPVNTSQPITEAADVTTTINGSVDPVTISSTSGVSVTDDVTETSELITVTDEAIVSDLTSSHAAISDPVTSEAAHVVSTTPGTTAAPVVHTTPLTVTTTTAALHFPFTFFIPHDFFLRPTVLPGNHGGGPQMIEQIVESRSKMEKSWNSWPMERNPESVEARLRKTAPTRQDSQVAVPMMI